MTRAVMKYQLTDAQFKSILEASKPTPVMYLSGGQPMFDSPQENANRAWKSVAAEHGVMWDSIRPVPGEDTAFYATPLLKEQP